MTIAETKFIERFLSKHAIQRCLDAGRPLHHSIRETPMKSLLCILLLAITHAEATAEDVFTSAEIEAIQSFLDERGGGNSAIVVGIVDSQGSHALCAGSLDNGTGTPVNGDTVFFIGSVTKTFTALALLEMAERGELQVHDPVAKYLSAKVKAPSYSGKQITLLDLATHTSGLPFNPSNMTGADGREEYETYTTEKMHVFLEEYKLPRGPGTEFEYSNLGMAVLGEALSRRAGTDYESLIIERVCRPLGMTSTGVTLKPEWQSRLAMGHDESGKQSPPYRLEAYQPAGGLFSTASDLLKYAAAQAGLTQSSLATPIAQSHVFRHVDIRGLPGQQFPIFGRTAMDWVDRNAIQPTGMELLGHAGGAGSYHAWIGFDKRQQRGVVVLTTDNDVSTEAMGWTVLQRLPLTVASAKDFARELVGIGAALDVDPSMRMLRITQVMANSPASQAGLLPGTLIQTINGVSTVDKSASECANLIRGPVGTRVRLDLTNSEGDETKSVELVRAKFATSPG